MHEAQEAEDEEEKMKRHNKKRKVKASTKSLVFFPYLIGRQLENNIVDSKVKTVQVLGGYEVNGELFVKN